MGSLPRTLKTLLKYIEYVGLGQGQSARLVSSPEGAGLRTVSGVWWALLLGDRHIHLVLAPSMLAKSKSTSTLPFLP